MNTTSHFCTVSAITTHGGGGIFLNGDQNDKVLTQWWWWQWSMFYSISVLKPTNNKGINEGMKTTINALGPSSPYSSRLVWAKQS